jgi:hypothetical protein
MTSRRIRKIAALVMSMVLAVGLTTHGVGLPNMAATSGANAALMDMPVNVPMPGKCKGCIGGEKGVASAVCSAFCSAAIVLPATPSVLLAGAGETLKPGTGPDVTGHIDPPEPYPPRTIILS